MTSWSNTSQTWSSVFSARFPAFCTIRSSFATTPPMHFISLVRPPFLFSSSRRSARRKGSQTARQHPFLSLCPPSCPMGFPGSLGRSANRLHAASFAARPKRGPARVVQCGVRLRPSVFVDGFDGGEREGGSWLVDGEREEKPVLLRMVYEEECDVDVHAARFD